MHLFLIGYRATGKSSVAIQLAKELQLPVVDLDQNIVERASKSIQEIFEQDGEEHFRELETRCLEALGDYPPAVVALGGGAVLAEANQNLLEQLGKAVWLQASVDQILQRLAQDLQTAEQRPALTDLSQTAEVRTVLESRRKIYAACADYSVDTNGQTVAEVAQQIANWWQSVDN